MIVLHGAMLHDQFLLWGETEATAFGGAFENSSPANTVTNGQPSYFPSAASYGQMREALAQSGLPQAARRKNALSEIYMPCYGWLPLISSQFVSNSQIGISPEKFEPADYKRVAPVSYMVPSIRLDGQQLIELLCNCVDAGVDRLSEGVQIGADLHFWALAMQFACVLVGKQQFLPGIKVSPGGTLASQITAFYSSLLWGNLAIERLPSLS